ncbi:FCD domain-containing protein [Streptomyces thermocoprophilus]
MTLREVLKVLQEQGLVESRRGRYGGTFVRPRPDAPDAAELRRRTAEVDLEDVLRFREVLETGAAGLCAAHGLTGEGRSGCAGRWTARGRRRSRTTDGRDSLLHLTLAELSGSPSLTAQYAAVRATVNDLLDCIPLLVRNLEHSQRQHTALVEAVLDGDADAAREIMREHCAGTAALLRGFLS